MTKNKFIILLIISLIFPILISFRLLRPGYFSMQDDIQIFRLQQLDSCLKDGQFPCRFIADGGFGLGYPLYNYYSPLPYAVAEGFHLIGFSYINSIKAVFIIPNFVRAISMYLLAGTFFGPIGGLISSVLYTLAPYQAVNGFVRGALGEYWALSLIPLIFYALSSKKNNLFILSLAFLFLSHNLTTLYVVPVLFIFSLITKNFNKKFIFNSLFAFLLSAFFLLPAFFEKNLITINTMTQGYFYYVNHFATLSELFISRFWGYGASLWGPKDDMSFQIGYLHWIIPTIVIIFYLLKPKSKHRLLIISFFLIGLFAVFLTHNKSTFIWKTLPFMAYYQFPWRFLGLVIFCFSFISGALINLPIIKKYTSISSLIIIIAIFLLNFSYFKEDIWYPNLTDSQKLTFPEIIRQSGAGLKDYWPKYSTDFPTQFSSGIPLVESGQTSNLNFSKNSHTAKGSITVLSDSAVIDLPMVYFPNWQLFLNGQKTSFNIEPKLGLIQLDLPTGNYNFSLKLFNTPIRTISNYISLIALVLFIIKLIREKHS
jgi:hypothetical protein